MLSVGVGAEDEVVVDGLLLDLSSLPPQAAVAKSRDSAEAASATRLMVWDMTILLLRWNLPGEHWLPVAT
jgi:hypothetical protein